MRSCPYVRWSAGWLVGRSRKRLKCAKQPILSSFFIPITSHDVPHSISICCSLIHSFIHSFINHLSNTLTHEFLISEDHLLAITWPCLVLFSNVNVLFRDIGSAMLLKFVRRVKQYIYKDYMEIFPPGKLLTALHVPYDDK